MKNLIQVLALVAWSIHGLYAQALQGFSYQGVARNAQGQPLANQPVTAKFSILQGSVAGTAIYAETHATTTNALGLFSLTIGQGTPVTGIFSKIDWATTLKFLKVEINNSLVGTTPFWSVPYALYAANGSKWTNNPTGIHYTTGNVGIGTTMPQRKLSIVGTSTLNSDPDDRSFLHILNLSNDEQAATTIELATLGNGLTLLRHTSPNYTVMNNLRNFFDISTQGSNGIMLRTIEPQSTIRFGIGSNGMNVLERLVIDYTGHVGIGTSTPRARLHVTGGDVFIENVNSGVIMKSPNGTCWRMTVSNTGQPVFTATNCPN
jgi:hypothetical protein